MATRFYLPSTGTPSISPAFSSGWDIGGTPDRIKMVRTRINSSMADSGVFHNLLTGYNAHRQYISSEQLDSQTVTGTVKGQVRCNQNVADSTAYLTFFVRKCNSSGGSPVELAASGFVTTRNTDPPRYNNGALENRRGEEGNADFACDLTETIINRGDYLIIEIGSNIRTLATAFTVNINFGDNSGTDLGENETDTSAFNPWFEFTHNFVFYVPPPLAPITSCFPVPPPGFEY